MGNSFLTPRLHLHRFNELYTYSKYSTVAMEAVQHTATGIVRGISKWLGQCTGTSVWSMSSKYTKSHETLHQENSRVEILWDLKFQTHKQLLNSQLYTEVIDKKQGRAVVTDVAIPTDSNIRKK